MLIIFFSFSVGEDPMMSDQQQYHYMTAENMKSLQDDSLKIDVTRDEQGDALRDSMGMMFLVLPGMQKMTNDSNNESQLN